MRIFALLAVTALLATDVRPARAQSATCDRCMQTHPCGDALQACFLDCRDRFPDPTALDVAGLFDACNTDCNRRFSICTSLAQSECAFARQCP